MKIILYTYKFRLEPTDDQKVILSKYFGSIRFVYNYFLNQRKEEYLNNKKSITYNQQSSFLTQLKKDENFKWLKEINSQTLQYSLNCLDIAYQSFFKKKSKFPKFKSRRHKNTFTIPQNVKVVKDELVIPKLNKGIKFNKHRKIEGLIKKASISRTTTGKYFVTILVEKQHIPINKTNKKVGIDLGLKDFLVLSNGLKIKGHRFLKHYERGLKLNQQHLSRKTKGSKRYENQRLKVCRIHEKISNSRMDLIHKTTSNLIQEFDIIYLEDLNIKGMVKNRKLSKSISDVSWGKFIQTLEYKSIWNDKEVIKIDRFFPSSKTCNKCGYINSDLKLEERQWVCPSCNEKLDRDLNAAINILSEGLRLNISDGASDYGRGAKIRPSSGGASVETTKEKDQLDPETTKSLV